MNQNPYQQNANNQPQQGAYNRPQGQAAPPQGQAAPPQGQAVPPQGQAVPPQGQAAPPQGQAVPPRGQYAPPRGQNVPPQGYYYQQPQQRGYYYQQQPNYQQGYYYQQPRQPQQGYYYAPVQQPQPQRTHRAMSDYESVFRYLILAGLFIFLDFSVFYGFSLGFTIAYAILFIISTLFIYDKRTKQKLFPITCGAMSVTLSVGCMLYTNSILKPLSVFVIFALFAIYCLGISKGFSKHQGSFKMIFDVMSSVIVAPFENFSKVHASSKARKRSSKINHGVLIGILLAVPVLLVVIPLLKKGDAAFEGLISAIGIDIRQYIVEVIFAAILLPFFYSYLFEKRRGRRDRKEARYRNETKKVPSTIITSFLSVISITYLIYIVSQLAYFFSVFRGILPEGYDNTASAFARRGFYEMFIISVINIALVSAVIMLSERKNKKIPALIKALSSFILMFSILLIIIAMQKMSVNIGIYGLSVNRILVSTFMVMMIVVVAFFILHIFAPKVKYMKPVIIICSAIFIALTFADIDTRVADYNINAYNSGKIEDLDVKAIANLSESAVPYLIDLTKSDDKKIAEEAKVEIRKIVVRNNDLMYNDEGTAIVQSEESRNFRAYNLTKQIAFDEIKEYYNSLSDREKEEFKKVYFGDSNDDSDNDSDSDSSFDRNYYDNFEYDGDDDESEYEDNESEYEDD